MSRKRIEQDRRQFDRLSEQLLKNQISRRQFLKGVGALGTALAFSGPVSALLAACSPQATAVPTGAASTAAAPTSAAGVADKTWPITNLTTTQLADVYKNVLPFTDVLPLAEGPIGDKPIVLGFSQTGFNHPWRVEMIKSAQAEVARHPNVSLVITDGNVDIAKQNNDVDDLLAQNVDAVVMSPVESAGLVPAGTKVMNASKPLILLDRDIPSTKTLFIGQSNVTMAKAVGDVMVKKLNGKGNLLEITGLIGSSPAIDRQKGMMQAIEGTEVKILATGDGQWIREPAVKLMEDWLVAYDQIDAVFSHAEESSWGAQFAIARANRCGQKIMHFTHDASNAGFKSAKAGLFQADGNYSPFIGDIGVRAALMSLQGQDIPNKQKYEFEGWLYRLGDLPVVTPENADDWLGKGWGDFEPPENPC
jgi:ABC-type sugar transport system substrate-binding protein